MRIGLLLALALALVACPSHTTTTTVDTIHTTQHPTPDTATTTTTTTTTITTDTKPAPKPPHDPGGPGGCPAHAPNIGRPCDAPGLSCNYGPLYVCNAGMWEARFSK